MSLCKLKGIGQHGQKRVAPSGVQAVQVRNYGDILPDGDVGIEGKLLRHVAQTLQGAPCAASRT